jgi:signal transduction histidine kinase
LAAQILTAEETERRRIARELHDDFGQDLALISVELDLFRQRPSAPAEAGKRLDAIAARVKQLSSSIHELSHELHPMKLEQLGLVSAVRGLCNELAQSHDLPIEFSFSDVPPSIPANVSLCLYRIAQEALRNVIKHSGAASASVTLHGRPGALSLEICDTGRGFDPGDAASRGGLGLVSIRERLRLVEGGLKIERLSTGGTRLMARVPLPAAEPVQIQLIPTAASS